MFSNSSYDAQVTTEIADFDTAVAKLADACVNQSSEALYTSSAAYVARDMAAIVDAVDGVDAKLNYWGFSYGTICMSLFSLKYSLVWEVEVMLYFVHIMTHVVSKRSPLTL